MPWKIGLRYIEIKFIMYYVNLYKGHFRIKLVDVFLAPFIKIISKFAILPNISELGVLDFIIPFPTFKILICFPSYLGLVIDS